MVDVKIKNDQRSNLVEGLCSLVVSSEPVEIRFEDWAPIRKQTYTELVKAQEEWVETYGEIHDGIAEALAVLVSDLGYFDTELGSMILRALRKLRNLGFLL